MIVVLWIFLELSVRRGNNRPTQLALERERPPAGVNAERKPPGSGGRKLHIFSGSFLRSAASISDTVSRPRGARANGV
jgi:hypothetical protein